MTREEHLYQLKQYLRGHLISMCPASSLYWKEHYEEVIQALKQEPTPSKAQTIDYRRAFKIACDLLNGAVLYGVDSDEIFKTMMDRDGVVTKYSYEEYILNHLQELDHGEYAIKALEQEPTTKNNLGVDCISRAEAIRVASGYCHPSNVAKELANLPSVIPQEPRWIPVSERMPEEDTDVLVTLECGLTGIMQKKLADDDYGEPCYIWQDFEGEEFEVVAWMPLPQVYKENRNDRENN